MIVLVGPSACGKTAFGKYLETKGLKKVITYTSRFKRINEIDGIDYHFLSKTEFEKRITTDFFYEYVIYQDEYYGTAKNSLVDGYYLIVEPQGLKKFSANPNIFTFFIDCPKNIRYDRMIARKDDIELVKKRIATDDLIFNDDIKKICDYILDGTKTFAENYEIVKGVIDGLC